jgi:hypothetical protein
MKVCCKCNIELPLTEYYYEKGKPKGACKKCRRDINKINHLKWRQTPKGKELLKKSKKKYEDKISEPNRLKREEQKREKEILLKEREQRKQERLAKQEEKNQKKEEYKKLMEYYASDEWKEIKKQKERDRQRKKWKRKWEEDEMFAMKVRLRNLIRNSFRRGGYRKFETSTEEVVGLKYDEFKKHLESKFLDGMSWENRGEWHIDHIIPLSSANSKEELIKLCHYSNFQPLWAEDNISKGDRM